MSIKAAQTPLDLALNPPSSPLVTRFPSGWRDVEATDENDPPTLRKRSLSH